MAWLCSWCSGVGGLRRTSEATLEWKVQGATDAAPSSQKAVPGRSSRETQDWSKGMFSANSQGWEEGLSREVGGCELTKNVLQ